MWRYQTSDRSGREEQWQLDAQQDHASMYGVGLSSPHTMPSAWKFGNAPLKQPDDQPVAAGSSHCGGNWRTLPFHDRWQLSTPMLPFQSAGIFNQYCTGSASAPAHDPACFDQAAQAGYPQYSLADTQWQSPSSYRSGCQRHRFVLQQPAQLHSALTAALSLTAGAAGPSLSHCDHDLLQEEQHQEFLQLQDCQQGTPFPGMRCLSGLEQLSLDKHPEQSSSWPLRCSSVPKVDQFSETATNAATPWLSNDRPKNSFADEVLPRSCSTQASGLNDEDVPAVLKGFSATTLLNNSSESQCCKGEADQPPEAQPSKVTGRKKKTKLDHITVEFLQSNHCFDMPLADAAKSLDIGLSVMKRLCRNLGLARWPYRTRSSLRAVIEKTERYLADTQLQDQEEGSLTCGQKANVLEALETHMNAVTGRGGADLDESIKKYRQAIFKLNYKLKKSKMNHKARHRIAVPQNAAERVLADQNHESKM